MPSTFESTSVPGVVIITPKVFGDSRGFLMETYKRSEFEAAGLPVTLVQENHSQSSVGTLRGLHYQREPKAQGKLVRVVRGEVFDVVAIAGAFAYAELARQMPRAGGRYVFLREAWHPAVGFLYGWALLLMIETGAIAAVAITFAQYALRLVDGPQTAVTGGRRGVDRAAVGDQLLRRQDGQPGAERARRAESRGARHPDSLRVVPDRRRRGGGRPPATAWPLVVRARHVRRGADPDLVCVRRMAGFDLHRRGDAESGKGFFREACVLGTLSVVAIYLLVNVAYLRTLGLEGLAGTATPAADNRGALDVGAAGERFVSAAIAISTFGFLNLSVLAPTRVSTTRWPLTAPFIHRSRACIRDSARRWIAIILQAVWAMRAGADRARRALAQLGRVRRLDLLRVDRRRRS